MLNSFSETIIPYLHSISFTFMQLLALCFCVLSLLIVSFSLVKRIPRQQMSGQSKFLLAFSLRILPAVCHTEKKKPPPNPKLITNSACMGQCLIFRKICYCFKYLSCRAPEDINITAILPVYFLSAFLDSWQSSALLSYTGRQNLDLPWNSYSNVCYLKNDLS